MRQHSGSASTVLSLALGATHQTGLISLRRPRGIVGPVVAVVATLLSLLLLLMPIPRTAAGSAASASSGLVALILRVGPGGIVGMQVVRHASIDGATLSICCSCGPPLRCLDFVLQSINLFFCFLSLSVRWRSTHTNTEAHKMCCNSKSTSERSISLTDETFPLLVENAPLGPNATPRTELLSWRKDRGAEVRPAYRKKLNRWGPCRRLESTPRLDSTRYRKRLIATERNAMQRT